MVTGKLKRKRLFIRKLRINVEGRILKTCQLGRCTKFHIQVSEVGVDWAMFNDG